MTDIDLDMFEAIAARRRSIRGYRPSPVDANVIARAVRIASLTPSSCNVQPWKLHIVSGDALRRLATALSDPAAEISHDIVPASPYSGIQRQRQIDAAVRLYAAEGVGRYDSGGRMRSALRNFNFFGAPHTALLFVQGNAGPREIADCGAFLQMFVIALTAAGIGSCIQASIATRADRIRSVLGLQAEGKLLCGVSFGFADPEHATASVRTERATISEIAHFHYT